jgi:hypothetical protein
MENWKLEGSTTGRLESWRVLDQVFMDRALRNPLNAKDRAKAEKKERGREQRHAKAKAKRLRKQQRLKLRLQKRQQRQERRRQRLEEGGSGYVDGDREEEKEQAFGSRSRGLGMSSSSEDESEDGGSGDSTSDDSGSEDDDKNGGRPNNNQDQEAAGFEKSYGGGGVGGVVRASASQGYGFGVALFEPAVWTNANEGFYRYFRIVLTGWTSSRSRRLCLSRLELYGDLLYRSEGDCDYARYQPSSWSNAGRREELLFGTGLDGVSPDGEFVGQGSGMGGGAIETRAAVRAMRDQRRHAPICACTRCMCERAGAALEMGVWEERMQANREKMISCLDKVVFISPVFRSAPPPPPLT